MCISLYDWLARAVLFAMLSIDRAFSSLSEGSVLSVQGRAAVEPDTGASNAALTTRVDCQKEKKLQTKISLRISHNPFVIPSAIHNSLI